MTTTTQASASTKLVPVDVTASIEAAAEALFDGRRARPCCVMTPEGRAMVCSARTARKNGWTILARAWR